jgi:hypothetical protein
MGKCLKNTHTKKKDKKKDRLKKKIVVTIIFDGKL